MASPFIGEIRLFAGNFAPQGWAFCNGQLMPIAQNDALFTLIGTTYGGDGQTTFALPNLQSRVPVHQGRSSSGTQYVLGQSGGAETVALLAGQLPPHGHVAQALASVGGQTTPSQTLLAGGASQQMYTAQSPATAMSADAIRPAGGSQPHENRQPSLALSFILSLFGIFPSQ